MDVIELRQFYASRLGRQVQKMLARRLAEVPMPPAGGCLLGLGFATPWLGKWRRQVRRTIAFMPAHQGAMRWPADDAPASVLVDEAALPLPDACVDLALVVHALELTPARERMLAELFRVLAPSGQVLFVVPNRSGLWARADSLPFGQGRPFSRRQLDQLLRGAMFTPLSYEPLLFMPPKRPLRLAPATWERLGALLWPGFSGLILARAVKQVYARRAAKNPALAFPKLYPAPPSPATSLLPGSPRNRSRKRTCFLLK